MLKEKAKAVLLLLIIFSNKSPATVELRRVLQSKTPPQKLIHLSRKRANPRLIIRTENNENFGFLALNRQNQESSAQNITYIRLRRGISTSAEPEETPETNPEPRPEWSAAIRTWGKAWDLHIYLFSVVYILIAVTSAVGLVDDVLADHRIKGLKLTLYLSLLFFCFSRAIILLVDPYSSSGTLDPFSAYITWSMGFPCVLTALGLLLLVFIDATDMTNVAPPRFQKLSTALGVMVINAIVVVVTDIIFLLIQKLFVLIIICHLYFVFFGVILTIGFCRVGFQLSSNSAASLYGDTGLQRLRFLVFITAVLNLLFIGIQVYSAVFNFSLHSDVPGAWPWYAVQTTLRALEVSMCVVMLFIAFNNRVKTSAACWSILPNGFRNAVSPFRRETISSPSNIYTKSNTRFGHSEG